MTWSEAGWLTPGRAILRQAVEIVNHAHGVTGIQQAIDQMRANKAGTASDQCEFHSVPPLIKLRRAKVAASMFCESSYSCGQERNRPSQVARGMTAAFPSVCACTLMAAVAGLGYLLIATWHRLFVKKHLFNKETCFFEDAT